MNRPMHYRNPGDGESPIPGDQHNTGHHKEPGGEVIQNWLIDRLAEHLEVESSSIDIAEPFASYGLESVDVVGLSGDLEERLGRELSPTLLYDYPTIESLAQYLAGGAINRAPLLPLPAGNTQDVPVPDATFGGAINRAPTDTAEPIAIIGIGCRFPGAGNPEAFWRLLRDGVDAISEVPADRWDSNEFYSQDILQPGKMNTRWGGFLEQIDRFDARFFGISPREAERMDPQQRLLLEVAWEALEDACQVPEALIGARSGVFIGIANSDYSRMQFGDPELSDAYAGTGSAYSVAANRISYLLDWRGPSMAIDTACSSSLVAVHLACQSLWKGESTLALAGGVNLVLTPELTVNFTKAGFMAPDGRCKAFDALANGYVRGEGAGVVVLKPLSRAVEEGDPIYAVIRGSAVNQDGRSNGLTAPNRQSQEAVLQSAYQQAGVSPGQVQYIEAHGTGTALGDPIEANALGGVLAIDRAPGNACMIGSVKTNIGHLEAAAGIAGLIKVALSLKHGMLPPSLHFNEPNPYIPFAELPLRVQTSLTPWPQKGGAAVAGVSSFGFGGTNAHVVLDEVPQSTRQGQVDTWQGQAQALHVLPLSARNPEALRALAQAYLDFLNPGNPEDEVTLADTCYTASTRRNHHDYRLATVAHTREEFSRCLDAYLKGESSPGMQAGRKDAGTRPKLVFVFPGQGSQWVGMGRQLLASEPVFAEALVRCEQAMQPHVDWSLRSVLTSEEGATLLERIDIIQPTLFAIQVSLAALWHSWGVAPDAVVGHSMGEVAAAYVAGALSLQDASRVICRRSKLLRRVSGRGAMAQVELSLEQAEQVAAQYTDRLSVAVSNSPRSTVLSGEPAALEEVLSRLEQHNIFCRRVKVDVASHSPQMEPLRAELMGILDGLQPHLSTIPMYSTVTGIPCTGQELDAAYWVRNLREPVRFATALQLLITEGHAFYLELSPHPILLPAIQEGLQYSHREGLALASMRRELEEQAVLLESLGALYAHGYPVGWQRLYPTRGTCVSLPAYPWQRERFWLEPARNKQRLREAPRKDVACSPLLGGHIESSIHPSVHYWENDLNIADLPYLNDHCVQGQVVVPATVYLEMALAAANDAFGAGQHILEEVTFPSMLALAEGAEQTVQVVLSDTVPGMATFQISSRLAPSSGEKPADRSDEARSRGNWTLHASGTIRLGTAAVGARLIAPSVSGDPGHQNSFSQRSIPQEIAERCTEVIEGSTYYEALREQGLEYGPSFQAIEQVWRRESEAIARLRLPEAVQQQVHAYTIHPSLLDSCFQVMGAALSQAEQEGTMSTGERVTYLPVGLDSLQIHARPERSTSSFWSHAQLLPQTPAEGILHIPPHEQASLPIWKGNLLLLDPEGRALIEARGLRVQRLSSARQQKGLNNWLYTVNWHPQPRQVSNAGDHEVSFPSSTPFPPLRDGLSPHSSPNNAAPDYSASWIIFTDRSAAGQQLQALLQARGERCTMVSPGEKYERLDTQHYRLNPTRLPDFLQLLEDAYGDDSGLCSGIVHLWGMESAPGAETTLATLETAQQLGCVSVLHLVQALSSIGWRDMPRLWLVTQATQPVVVGELASSVGRTVAQAPLWGLGRTIRHEHPRLQCTLVDLSPSEASPEEIETLAEELWGKDQEDQLALRGRTRYVARLQRYLPQPIAEEEQRRVQTYEAGDQPFRLELDTPGILDHLTLRATARRKPGPGEVEIEVAAAGLNFLDVLMALGIAPVQEPGVTTLGAECAGRVTALGTGVVGFEAGDEVVALAEGSIGTHVTAPVHLVVAKPPHLSFEQAASIPIAFMTADYALRSLARISSGERVLIHSASGGTGLAAVQLAQLLGAEIFATAGSPMKREYLRSLGIRHVMDSRSLTFAEEVLAATQGHGVDVVLNSLTGAAMTKSLSVLSSYGRFVELGKKDIYLNNLLELSPFRKNLSYFALDLAGMVRERPEKIGALLREVMQSFREELLKPLPTSIFPICHTDEAFHTMAQAKHIGKLVISLQGRNETRIAPAVEARCIAPPIRADGTYLITGGLGGIGLKVARWLVEQGARYLVLLGRSGASAIVEEHLASLTRDGVQVRVARVDVRRTEQVARLLQEVEHSMPPLRGIIHAAGILDDDLLLKLDAERFQRVLEPKVLGAWNLHTLTQDMPLDFFVLFSSAASLLGSPGQGNYAAANAFLDALAHHRQALNLPALSIDWGPWAEVGLAASSAKRGERLALMGISSLSPEQGMEALDFLLSRGTIHRSQVGVIPLNLRQWRQSYPQAASAPFFARLIEEEGAISRGQGTGRDTSGLYGSLLAADVDHRRALLEEHLREQIARVLRLSPSQIDVQTPLSALGLDSMMALEFRNRMEDSLEVTLPATVAWSYPTIAALAGHIAEKMGIALGLSGSRTGNVEDISFSPKEEEDIVKLLEVLQEHSGVE